MNRKLESDSVSRMGTYFGGRRRVYWGQQGGFYPPYSLSRFGPRIAAGPAVLSVVVPLGLLAFLLIKGIAKN